REDYQPAPTLQIKETIDEPHEPPAANGKATPADAAVSAMMGALTGMFGNMSEAFRRMGRTDAAEPADAEALSVDSGALLPVSGERDAELRAKDAEIERLKERLEKLESALTREDADAEAQNETQAETPTETDEDSEIGSIFDLLFGDGAPTGDESVPEVAEPMAEETERAEDTGRNEESAAAAENDGRESGFDILAFLDESEKQREAQLTVFDRMRRDGKTSAPMTLKDLNHYLESIAAS
ncbi:MAG: hypothetical protein IJV64_08530, partial [Oscillospiraceae bacterium]|nr:hypothetical protein [Oscillospiraceae bacterium]